jgi:hypothetical protein
MIPQQPFWMGQQQKYNDCWEVIQGDALAYYLEMFCDCPNVIDITGYQFVFQIKDSLDPDDPNVLCEVLWTAQGSWCGITALIVLPKLTATIPDGRYAFDCKYRTPSGLVGTVRRGTINVLPSSNLDFSLNKEVPPIGWTPPISEPPHPYYNG